MWKDKKAGLKKFEPFQEVGEKQVLSGGQILGTQGKVEL